jgi:hypothetical protein
MKDVLRTPIIKLEDWAIAYRLQAAEARCSELERERDAALLKAQLCEFDMALRLGFSTLEVETPKEHRVRGQHQAFTSGLEAAYIYKRRDNPYEFHTAQYRAWETGFRMGAERYASDYTKGHVAIAQAADGATTQDGRN